MTDKQKQEINTLQELSQPLREYLAKNHNPYCAVVVTYDDIKIVETQVNIPLPSCER